MRVTAQKYQIEATEHEIFNIVLWGKAYTELNIDHWVFHGMDAFEEQIKGYVDQLTPLAMAIGRVDILEDLYKESRRAVERGIKGKKPVNGNPTTARR